MPDTRLRTSGEHMFGWVALGAMFVGKLFIGLLIIAGTLGMISMDVLFGPRYLFTVAKADGIPIHGFAVFAPWVLSLATTGLLYCLWSREQGFKAKSGVDAIAILIAVCDTLMDVGGYNAWRYHDVAVGSQILIPFNSPAIDQFQEGFAALICFAHMPFLALILGRIKDWQLEHEGGNALSDWIEAGCIKLAGWIFNTARAIAVAFGALSMLVLDLILTPLIGNGTTDTVSLLFMSGIITFGQYGLWGTYIHVQGRSGADSILSRASVKGFHDSLPVHIRRIHLGAWACTIVDSAFDLMGFNRTLFGQASFFPHQVTIAWVLVGTIVLALCTTQAMLITEVFDPVVRYFSPLGKKKDGAMGGFSLAIPDFGGFGRPKDGGGPFDG